MLTVPVTGVHTLLLSLSHSLVLQTLLLKFSEPDGKLKFLLSCTVDVCMPQDVKTGDYHSVLKGGC